MSEFKISKTWLKDHGWKKTVDDIQETPEYSRTIKRHHTSYVYSSVFGKHDIFARIDHIVTGRYYKGTLESRSSYYMFYARNSKTGFHVENRITHHPFSTDQIKAAMLAVGVVM